MKTITYLRLSLLIPLLVWGIGVLFFILWSKFENSGFAASGSTTITGLILWPILFYVFGILGWFLPYLMLSLVLLFWSFISRTEVLMKGFALAPVVMAILILAFLNLLSIGSPDWNILSSSPIGEAHDFFGSDLWFVILTLIWGYICEGVGFGLYKILQQLKFIKDEAITMSTPLNEPA